MTDSQVAADESTTPPTNRGTISSFTLHNNGAFFCNGGASVSAGNGKWTNYGYTDTLSEGQTESYDLGQWGIPDQSEVFMYVEVKAGYNKRASKECFTYDSTSQTTAKYTIHGVTANPNLTFGGTAPN